MSDEILIRPAALALLLNVGEPVLNRRIRAGRIPPYDGKGHANERLWKASTLRRWNPEVAYRAELLMQSPAIQRVKPNL